MRISPKKFFFFILVLTTINHFSQEEKTYKDASLKTFIDSLIVLSETTPKLFLHKIDSLKNHISSEDMPLFLIESNFLKGTTYRNLRDFDKVMFHFEKVKELAIKYKSREIIAEVYRELGDEYIDNDMYKKAIENYDKAIAIYKEFGNEAGVIVCTYEGFIENLQGKYQISTKKLKSKLSIFKKAQQGVYMDALSTIAENYMHLGKLDSSYYYVNKLPLHIPDPNNYNYEAHKNYIATRYFIDKKNVDSANYYNALIDDFRFEFDHHRRYFLNKIDIAKLTNDITTQVAYTDSLARNSKKENDELRAQNVNDTESLIEYEARVEKEKSKFTISIYSSIALIVFLVGLLIFLIKKFLRHRTKQDEVIAVMQSELLKSLQELDHIKLEKEEKNIDEIAKKINQLSKKYNLTEREIDVLLQITKGLNNKEIAEELFVSVNTIKYHTRNLYEKLDIKKRTEIASKLMYES